MSDAESTSIDSSPDLPLAHARDSGDSDSHPVHTVPDHAAAPAATRILSGAAAESAVARAFPAMQAKEAELARAIGRGRFISLRMGKDSALLRLELAPQSDVAWTAGLCLSGGFGSLSLSQGARLLQALTGIDLDGETDPGRWSWLQAAVIARLPGTPFAGTDRIVRSAPRGGFPLRIVLQSPSHAFTTMASADASAWLALLSARAWSSVRQPAVDYLEAPADIPVPVARHVIPAGVLGTLAVGDIIVPDNPCFACSGEGRIQLGGRTARVRYSAPSLLEVIALEGNMDTEAQMHDQQAGRHSEDAVAQPRDAGSDGASGDFLDAVPVRLDFELGRLNMLLGELRAIGVGTVLTLAGGSPGAIAVCSSGKTLGKGEIVDVDGKLGIRITAWGLS